MPYVLDSNPKLLHLDWYNIVSYSYFFALIIWENENPKLLFSNTSTIVFIQ